MKQIDFKNGSTLKNIIASAIPLLVAQILTLLYSIVDRIFIGRIPGEGADSLAGLGICFPIIMIVTAFTNLYGAGGAPLCSIAEGRGDYKEAERIMNTAFSLLVMTGLVLTVCGIAFAEPVLRLFGATDAMLKYAIPYLRIYLLGTIFTMTASGLNPYINAQGLPGVGMTTIAIGAVANIILDPIFILKMGIRGAAIATVIAQALSCGFVIRFLGGKKSGAILKIRFNNLASFVKPDPKLSRQITALGASSFVMQCTNSLVSIFCNRTLVVYGGELYIAILTIIASIRQILDVPILAMADGASPVLSFNYGAKCPEKVRKGILIMTLMGFAYTIIMWLLLRIFPGFFIGIFTDDTIIMNDTINALHLYFLAFIFQTFQYSAQTTFKALNKRGRAIFFSIFRKVILVVPLTVLLPRLWGLGTDGVFLAEPVSNVIGGLASFITMTLTIMPELKRMRD